MCDFQLFLVCIVFTMAKRNLEYLSRLKHFDDNKIRVGRDYQADIPPLRSSKTDVMEAMDSSDLKDEDKLLWQPSKICENKVQQFLSAIKSAPRPKMDEERALFLLHQCDYDAEEAYRRFQLMPTPSNTGGTWSEEECKLFERVLQLYGKKFDHVQKLVPTRSVRDVVEFYYFWKRSERYDAFITDKSIYGQSKYKRKARRKINRSVDPADAILDAEQFVDSNELGTDKLDSSDEETFILDRLKELKPLFDSGE